MLWRMPFIRSIYLIEDGQNYFVGLFLFHHPYEILGQKLVTGLNFYGTPLPKDINYEALL